MAKTTDSLEPIQDQAEHEFQQDEPHRSPKGCAGISGYIPRWWLRAYKTVLKSKGLTIAEDLNRHVIKTVVDSGQIKVWDVQRDTAEGRE